MLKFIFNSICIAACALALNKTMVSFITVPYAWGLDPCKLSAIETKHVEFDAFIIGSSRFGRQVIPEIVDSIDHCSSLLYSFDGTFAPLSFNLIDDLLENQNFSPRKVIIELAPILHIGEELNIRSPYIRSWYSFSDFLFVFRSNNANIGYFKWLKNMKNAAITATGSVAKGGFFFDQLKIALLKCDSIENTPSLLIGRSIFSDGAIEVIEAHNKANTSNVTLPLTKSEPYYQRVLQTTQLLNKRGICVLWVVAPRQDPTNAPFVRSMAKLMSNDFNVVDLSSPVLYPEFYKLDNVYDGGHLNEKGAIIFSEVLGREISSVCSN